MNVNLNQVLGTIFSLIALYLVISNADAFSSIIKSGGGFFGNETALLQGRRFFNGTYS